LRRAIAAAAAIALTLAPALAHAQDTPAKTVLLRDAETEQLLRDYAAPIFRAAGIDARRSRSSSSTTSRSTPSWRTGARSS
jgi:hypothetical protein